MVFAVWLKSPLPEYKVSGKKKEKKKRCQLDSASHCLSIHSHWLCATESTSERAWKNVSIGYCKPYVAVYIGSTQRHRKPDWLIEGFFFWLKWLDFITETYWGQCIWGQGFCRSHFDSLAKEAAVAMVQVAEICVAFQQQKNNSTCCFGMPRLCLRLWNFAECEATHGQFAWRASV